MNLGSILGLPAERGLKLTPAECGRIRLGRADSPWNLGVGTM